MNYYFSKQFAEEQAEQDFINYCVKTAKDKILHPIEPEHVAEILWGTSTCFAEKGVLPDGVEAQADLGSNSIIVEANDYEPRERFSTAHEVGHISLHSYLATLSEIDDKKHIFHEYQADTYAGAILMPKRLVQKVMDECDGLLNSEDYKVIKAADAFVVSKIAAKIRLQGLGYISDPYIHRSVDKYEKASQSERNDWFSSQK